MDFKKLAQGNKYAVNEKAPKFLYDALKEGEDFAFMRRDYKPWQVVMPLSFYKKLMGLKKTSGSTTVIICPHCGKEIYDI